VTLGIVAFMIFKSGVNNIIVMYQCAIKLYIRDSIILQVHCVANLVDFL